MIRTVFAGLGTNVTSEVVGGSLVVAEYYLAIVVFARRIGPRAVLIFHDISGTRDDRHVAHTLQVTKVRIEDIEQEFFCGNDLNAVFRNRLQYDTSTLLPLPLATT